MGEMKAGLDRMTGWGGMMEWDKITRELAEMEGWAEMLMGLTKMRMQSEMMVGLAEM